FEELGAKPDAARVDLLLNPSGAERGGALTEREAEVLALVAAGKTNREIARALRISEKTVPRPVSNIFMKLGPSKRAAATDDVYIELPIPHARSAWAVCPTRDADSSRSVRYEKHQRSRRDRSGTVRALRRLSTQAAWCAVRHPRRERACRRRVAQPLGLAAS